MKASDFIRSELAANPKATPGEIQRLGADVGVHFTKQLVWQIKRENPAMDHDRDPTHLSAGEQRLYDFCAPFVRKNKRGPMTQELMEATGIRHQGTLSRDLRGLRAKGKIDFEPGNYVSMSIPAPESPPKRTRRTVKSKRAPKGSGIEALTEYLIAHFEKHGGPPASTAVIAKAIGARNRGQVNKDLSRLRKTGVVSYDRGNLSTLRLLPTALPASKVLNGAPPPRALLPAPNRPLPAEGVPHYLAQLKVDLMHRLGEAALRSDPEHDAMVRSVRYVLELLDPPAKPEQPMIEQEPPS